MNILRKINEWELYQDPFTKLYAVSNQDEVSLWFDHYEYEYLIWLPDHEFVEACSEHI